MGSILPRFLDPPPRHPPPINLVHDHFSIIFNKISIYTLRLKQARGPNAAAKTG